MKKLLSVKGLTVSVGVRQGRIHAVRGVDFDLYEGESLGIVGESGSGKSLTVKSLMGLLPENASVDGGEALFKGKNLLQLSEDEFAFVRGVEIAMVGQNPSTGLNPIITVGKQMYDAIMARSKQILKRSKAFFRKYNKQFGFDLVTAHRQKIWQAILAQPISDKEKEELHKEIWYHRRMLDIDATKEGVKQTVLKLLEEVGIDNPMQRYHQYPFELSGGMKQRVAIAVALSGRPKIVIFDEPTTALDVTVQAQILTLIKKLQQERKFSIIFISHNLAVISKIADRVMVMYAGKTLEEGSIDEVYHYAVHPYTKALFRSLPSLDKKGKLLSIPGSAPTLLTVQDIDQFAPRNEQALEIDFKKEPPMFELNENHRARTWLCHSLAPTLQESVIQTENRPECKKGEVCLQVENLEKTFSTRYGETRALRSLSLNLRAGEILCMVGESGSGKTTLGKVIAGLVRQDGGRVLLNGKVLSETTPRGKVQYDYTERTKIQMIFQDSLSSLDPRMTVAEIVAEGLEISKKYDKEEIVKKTLAAMQAVGLESYLAERYPTALSGGQRQRVEIARALAVEPSVLIADEPVSDLDASVQASVVNLFDELRTKRDLGILFITHDLSVARYISDRIAVLYCGRLVELGDVDDVFNNPLHSYTKTLLASVPSLDFQQDWTAIEQFTENVNGDGEYKTDEKGHLVWIEKN